MGLHSEISAELHAKQIEPALLDAIKTKNPEIIDFCRKYFYPIYCDAVGET